jgi:hypothetical protein
MKTKCVQAAIASLVLATAAFAQPHQSPEGRTMLHSGAPGGLVGWTMAEMGPAGRVIKGSPYSATAVTEVSQTLADGNRIRRETSGAVYRDSEGRTRNETRVAGIGPMAQAGLPELITISDPVAGVNYLLNPAEKTAVKTQTIRHAGTRPPGDSGAPLPGGGGVPHVPGPAPQVEQLGTRNLEGVQAEGTRVTTTFPAGTIGNERPIEVVSERWYSNQLLGMVMTTYSDPRTGTATFRLTKISLGEPDRSLFEVPAGYRIVEGGIVGSVPGGGGVMQRRTAVQRHEQ